MTGQITEDEVYEDLEVPQIGPVRVAWAPVPKVNLLPIEILERRRFRRIQVLLAAAVVVAVLVGAGGVAWAQHGITAANNNLLTAQAQVTSLEAEQNRYATVPQVLADVDAAQAARTLALGQDVLWYRYLNNLQDALPTGVKMLTLTAGITASTPGAVAAAVTNPLSVAGIGTVTLSGNATEYSQVSTWLEGLNKIKGLQASSLSNATNTGTSPTTQGPVTYTVGSVVTSDALSGRYDTKAG